MRTALIVRQQESFGFIRDCFVDCHLESLVQKDRIGRAGHLNRGITLVGEELRLVKIAPPSGEAAS